MDGEDGSYGEALGAALSDVARDESLYLASKLRSALPALALPSGSPAVWTPVGIAGGGALKIDSWREIVSECVRFVVLWVYVNESYFDEAGEWESLGAWPSAKMKSRDHPSALCRQGSRRMAATCRCIDDYDKREDFVIICLVLSC
uniref:Uncharacterized protein n=1 Tax=Ananas comosus var. bracteatus TaxID=296719 RepID=A0A6V7PU47_ANACO|nr:unnamed protein product [Ananas comosus var. bracteatus]